MSGGGYNGSTATRARPVLGIISHIDIAYCHLALEALPEPLVRTVHSPQHSSHHPSANPPLHLTTSLHALDSDVLRKSRQTTGHWSGSHSCNVYNFGSTTQHIAQRRRRRALPPQSRSTDVLRATFLSPVPAVDIDFARLLELGIGSAKQVNTEHSISLSPCLEPHAPPSCVLFMFSTQRRSATPSSFFH